MSTNKCINSLLVRDKSLNSEAIPKLTSEKLIRLSKNPISYNEIKCDVVEMQFLKKLQFFWMI